MNEFESLICLNAVSGLGSLRLRRLYDAFGSASAVWKAGEDALRAVTGIGEQTAWSILDFDCGTFLKEETALLKKHQVQIITFFDEYYPEPLKEIPDSPLVLYARGSWQKDELPGIAVVGCRRASIYGLSVAKAFAGECARLGITTVSGMARGIDTSVHQGSLAEGGRTIAILGSGLARIYPKENARLFSRISEHGCVISEFSMATGPLAVNFPRRNRIISGLSCGVVVVEAAERSGALITSRCALEQGRDVFAVPGKISQPQSAGTNRLIQQGAKLVLTIDDVLEECQRFSGIRKPASAAQPSLELTPAEAKIFKIFSDEPLYIDDVVEQSGLSASNMMQMLLQWECRGWVKRLPGNYFVKATG